MTDNNQPVGQGTGAPIPPPPGGQGTGAPIPPPPVGQGTGAPIPPPPVEDKTPANYQIGTKLPQVMNIKVPSHKLNFDEQHFLRLLAGSISLTKTEKKRIISSIPKLKQEQVDELIRIFEEEKHKFAELSKKHVPQLEKLEKQHLADWKDIELEQKSQEKESEDTAQADEIRKKLGL